jgi:cytochrome c oxidase cbb3-type subunit 3
MTGGRTQQRVLALRLSRAVDRRLAVAAACVVMSALAACSPEKRNVGPSPPGTAPTGVTDSRQTLYATNRFEQAEGGRLFRWAGCDACHTETSTGAANLPDGRWAHGGTIAEIYRSIAAGAPGMPAYENRIPSRQIWQMAGYVKSLPQTKAMQRRRASAAQAGEPSGASWTGALR